MNHNYNNIELHMWNQVKLWSLLLWMHWFISYTSISINFVYWFINCWSISTNRWSPPIISCVIAQLVKMPHQPNARSKVLIPLKPWIFQASLIFFVLTYELTALYFSSSVLSKWIKSSKEDFFLFHVLKCRKCYVIIMRQLRAKHILLLQNNISK